jgi:hypothetical protein
LEELIMTRKLQTLLLAGILLALAFSLSACAAID